MVAINYHQHINRGDVWLLIIWLRPHLFSRGVYLGIHCGAPRGAVPNHVHHPPLALLLVQLQLFRQHCEVHASIDRAIHLTYHHSSLMHEFVCNGEKSGIHGVRVGKKKWKKLNLTLRGWGEDPFRRIATEVDQKSIDQKNKSKKWWKKEIPANICRKKSVFTSSWHSLSFSCASSKSNYVEKKVKFD